MVPRAFARAQTLKRINKESFFILHQKEEIAEKFEALYGSKHEEIPVE